MTNFYPFKAVLLGCITVLTCLVVMAPTQGQAAKPDPTTALQRPFVSLGDLLSDVQNKYTELGTMKTKLQSEKAKIQAERSSVQAAQDQVDRLRSAVDAAKSQVAGIQRKWKCNAYGVLHDRPEECSNPEQGGVWVTVNASGREVTPPTKADLNAIQAAEGKLATLEDNLDAKKAQLNKDEQAYKSDAQKYNADVDNLSKKVQGLSDPKQVIQDVRASYNDADSKAGKVDPAVTQALDKIDNLIGKKVGDGQCVSLVKAYDPALGAASTWKPGDKITKDKNIAPFAPAATFVDGVYPNKPSGNHAVIVLENTNRGLLVLDQYTGKRASPRLISFQGGRDDPDNQAKIKKGEQAADALVQEGQLKAGTYQYYQAVWKLGGYNPSNDADNYSYIKPGSSK
jgi:hypothetical protein